MEDRIRKSLDDHGNPEEYDIEDLDEKYLLLGLSTSLSEARSHFLFTGARKKLWF